MRADRLVAILLLMQSRGRVTAAEVAAELEVSVATARRDLEALSTAGVPVYPQAGRGGGWSLVGGARTDLTGLTATEARALFVLAGPAAGGTPQVRSALRKLVRALPETFRPDAEAAADAVVVDPTGWGARDRARPVLVDRLEDAVVRRRRITMEYAGRGPGRTRREVDPWGLVDKDGVWYLIAGTDRGQRTFRVDRISAAEVTDLPAHRPADFDLSREWDRVVGEMEQRRSPVTATLLIAERLLPVLRDHFGRHCETLETRADGRVRVRVAAHLARSIAETLAGWGATVEVLEPDVVRAELARLGAELVALYEPDRGA
ncbi:helix-turn-helix transcriptional regulator [Jidongwangia harbinensis]|uniref:helix-turn-helix transcriptional regulator n=1 Tax=Jidongwangia harbinensis TaxID=2878561 RepID=UPI001CDA0890|nr:WYL domain-containing protein [Jidongwangia harbinensis]MCA2212221.1 WYL domain-containing protein [Jidongwangia harbinensis]